MSDRDLYQVRMSDRDLYQVRMSDRNLYQVRISDRDSFIGLAKLECNKSPQSGSLTIEIKMLCMFFLLH